MKKCVACGMPMKAPSDFALGDINKDFCCYCANEDGSMKSFEEKKSDLQKLLIHTQGISQEVAEKMVVSMMKNLPAWRDYFQ